MQQFPSDTSELERLVLFFDFDDTLSEQTVFNLQYVRAIGNVLAPVYGGDAEAWAGCAIDMFVTLEAQYIARFRDVPTGYNAWFSTMHTQAMQIVFAGMGLPIPSHHEQLSRDTQRQALAQCEALLTDTATTLATLAGAGYQMHMASGNDSGHLQCALAGAHLNSYFDKLYGPDLIDCAKEGPEFYARIFHDLNLAPLRALIIDNDPNALSWAMSVGAQAIQVDFLSYKHIPPVPGIFAHLKNMIELLPLLTEVS